MFSMKSLKYIMAGALIGYVIIHPLIMVISSFMFDISYSSTIAGLLSEIVKAFSIPMLPWSLGFVILGGLIGFYFNRIRQADEDKIKLIKKLETSLSEIKTLSGLLPICSSCKKIRDDEGYWNQIESFIGEHAEVEFSHGICPECAKMLYPEYYKDNKSPINT